MSIKEPFESLTEIEKLYAHHLSRAAWTGARIILEQVSPEANDIFDFIMELYRSCDGDLYVLVSRLSLEKIEVDYFLQYAAVFLSNIGNYFGRGDQKFIPRVNADVLEKMSTVSEAAGKLWSKIKDVIYSRPPHTLGYPSSDSQSQYYPPGLGTITVTEINQVSKTMASLGIWPENTRLSTDRSETGVKSLVVLQASVDQGSETIRPAGPDGSQITLRRGDHGQTLSRICTHLKDALNYTSNKTQKLVIEKYIESFTTGDLEAYRESQKLWVQDKYPVVENMIGFIEPYRDPAGIRSEFEGIVAIENPEESKALRALVENSDQFIRCQPWARGCTDNNGKGPFEKATFDPPSFASIHTLTYCSTILFDGINLPNYNDIRQTHGFKNVVIANRMAANSIASSPNSFVPSHEAQEFQRHQFTVLFLWLVVHELLGHGTGKMMIQSSEDVYNFDINNPPVDPLTGKPIEKWYKPGETWTGVFGDLSTSVDECRCELVSACLMDNKVLLALFGYNDESDLKADDVTYYFYMQLGWSGLVALSNFNIDTKQWGQAHDRAHFAMLRCLLADGGGCVKIEHDQENARLKVVVDRNLIISKGKPALKKMLLRLHMYRVTADIDACRPYFESLSKVEEDHLGWRKTLMAQSSPRLIYVHANTFLHEGKAVLKEYEASNAGIVESWFDRAI
ncbi:hypothetical protein B0A52_01177 [Exophiala mesophila]|uniref:Dipeptidyl peptidase 3 n=1 Tax=Exophiala mesophila TaxID=212818 RepID=A0A438NGP6_EXOME|nr:hypothetical protein B0A52_01177 [Exophiala mesophila]